MNLSIQHRKELSVVKDMQTGLPKLKMCNHSVQLPAHKNLLRCVSVNKLEPTVLSSGRKGRFIIVP